MNKTAFFIDGFNLYHSIANPTFPHIHKYKWLNLSDLCKIYLPQNEKLVGIYYFTSWTFWNLEKRKRHAVYIKALETCNVTPIYGEFKAVEKRCDAKCKKLYYTYEEKETDVNIAITLFKMAHLNKFDRAIIITGDSDQVPTIKMMKELFPTKQIEVIIPFGRKAKELKKVAHKSFKIKELQLLNCQFPSEIDLGNNNFLAKPTEWG